MSRRLSVGWLLRGRADDPEQWRRNQYALAVAVFVWFAGSGFVSPFLALFVKDLGGFNIEEAAMWTGMAMAATPLGAATIGPLWGALSDRYGRKIMLQRCLVGFTISLALMAFVVTPWQVLAIRLGMGLVGGFVITALAVVSVSNPPERVSEGIGMIQSARVLGMAAGPFVGGVLADTFGIRNSFFVSAGLGVLAFGLVTVLVKESAPGGGRPSAQSKAGGSVRAMLTAPAFLGVLAGLVVIRLSERTFDPILPLLVGRLSGSEVGIATTSGIVISAGLVATSLAAVMVARLTREGSGRRLLLLSLAAGAITFLPLAFVQTWWQLLILRMLVGLVLGVAVTVGFLVGAEATPVERRGLGMGILGSGSGYGASAGALVAGAVSAIGLQVVFVVDAALFALALVVVGVAFRAARREEANAAERVEVG